MFDDYKLSHDRFKELKHFCRQYFDYIEEYETCDDGARAADLINAIKLIETTAESTSKFLYGYILEYVTEDTSISLVDPPVDELVFSYFVARFYWLLSVRKGV